VPPPRVFEQAVLTATTNAPADAMGVAVLSSGFWPIAATSLIVPLTNAPTVRVTTDGLPAGTYTLSVTDTATNRYVLGDFDVTTWTNPVMFASGSIVSPCCPLPPITPGGGLFFLPPGLDP